MLKYRIIIFLVNILLVSAEWVEMPQFSDDSKVYKLSVQSHDADSFYNKFSNNDREASSEHEVGAVAQLFDDFGHTDGNISGEMLSYESKYPMKSSEPATVYPVNLSDESLDDNDDDDEVNIFAADSDTELSSSDVGSSTTAEPPTLQLASEEYSGTTTSTVLKKLQDTSWDETDCGNETIEGLKFQDYLPMGILTKVHRTLKSQPSTLKGKIIFLKKFERDLIAEIETRLGTALSPPRRTRGAHDYYDHDDEMGFPSLEGALMAISFLTFSVYLVRLVMLLFRSNNTTTTNAGAATIFVGSNRRSTDTLNNKTEEIMKYLNSFKGNM